MTAINALRTSTSGLNAQAVKLSGISNNIANSSTVGYKRVDTQFESLVLEGSSSGSYALAGVTPRNRVEISKVGQVQRTGVDTDIAVSGNGFLVVNENSDSTGKYLATRAGSFRPDAFGNLVNSAGFYLQGVKLGADGLPVGNLGDNNVDSLSTVNVNNISVASAPTTEMRTWFNLPKNSTGYASPPPPADSFVSSIDYYDPTGGTQTLTYRFTPVLPEQDGAPDTSSWTLEIFDSASGDLASTNLYDTTKRVAALGLQFWSNGTSAGTLAAVWDATAQAAGAAQVAPGFTAPVGSAPLLSGVPNPATYGANASTPATNYGTPDNLAAANVLGTYDAVKGTLTVRVGVQGGFAGTELPITIGTFSNFEGITQLTGNYLPTKIEKNGSAFGLLERVSVADDGQVIATFSNGKSRPIYALKLAVFPNANGLNPVSGDAYEMSLAAGAVRLIDPGTGAAGTTNGGALESSNVDIGTELTNLIETQRAYSSNATVVRTADQMLEEATNLKR
ncbi:flagellar hook protein FlgE [Teichococcus cervicalis]|uniref:Flagellar hook protein FlgE n=1 Tax=Pseudoroseomonas cervicalis ATCC 49957 TaxID=525371 RepID=D5RG38_9PROT|nr:flagellar hook-basal body complex protein [Pseudoroseomonas cervicalis]EFH13727.1 flagellar hook-basal body protein [Pseudoroseomonas cervicalis ATCC 49957]